MYYKGSSFFYKDRGLEHFLGTKIFSKKNWGWGTKIFSKLGWGYENKYQNYKKERNFFMGAGGENDISNALIHPLTKMGDP